MATKTINERLYNFSAGSYSGVLMTEKVFKKLAKINAKYSDEVRKVLSENKSQLYNSDWTLANHVVDGEIKKQISIYYVDENCRDVDHRIGLFKAPEPSYIPIVYQVSNRAEATAIAEDLIQDFIEGNGE